MELTAQKEAAALALTSFAGETVLPHGEFKTELIYNDIKQGKTVVSSIERLLKDSREFYFAVAFITKSGLIMLKNCLKLLEQRGVRGQILTTDYLYFNDPAALEELMGFSNIAVRVYMKESFHIKGYAFMREKQTDYIIGSSNLTQEALKVNKEWNIKFACRQKSELGGKLDSEFLSLWRQAQPLTPGWLEKYRQKYLLLQKSRKRIETLQEVSDAPVKANEMQRRVLAALDKLRSGGRKKALLISATGTGKTFLSAFDAEKTKPHRLLFVAHREQILRQAEKSYKKILGGSLHTGFLSGSKRDLAADYIFATINMMARDDIRGTFAPTYFDYIVIDETHRAGAAGYRRLIEYFRPAFMLGMTATPERTDDFDIYKLFDNNVAYEIRLQEAMQEKLLCPFHYFGIADIEVDGKPIDDSADFNALISAQRVRHITDQAGFYGFSGERVRGLVFCRTIDEAGELAERFSQIGFNTMALSANDPQAVRDRAVARLEQGSRKGGLDYVFSVDILNEGVDIPAVNQIIMLRPTKSPIVFVQQLGRGLRRSKGKEYVVVLDFIGNYSSNFMIPLALFGDNSCNKDNMRRCVNDGKNILCGPSTVSFDEIARKQIYEAIDKARLNDAALLKKAYEDLKNKLGRIPAINDFECFGTIDIMKYVVKFGSYHSFLRKYEKTYDVILNEAQEEILLFIGRRFASGKRIYEIELLAILLNHTDRLFARLMSMLEKEYKMGMSRQIRQSVINNLTNVFTISNEREKYSHCLFIQKTGEDYAIAGEFRRYLQNASFKREIESLLNLARARYMKYYRDTYKETSLCLYRKYTYEEVCCLLNWPQKINPNAMAGYFYEKTTHTMPVFINYIKPDQKRVDYANEFLSDRRITAYSKLNRKIDSSDALHIYNAAAERNRIYLFVRKPYEDKETKEFYFLGEIKAAGKPVPAPKYNGFKVIYELAEPVREDIFDYLTS